MFDVQRHVPITMAHQQVRLASPPPGLVDGQPPTCNHPDAFRHRGDGQSHRFVAVEIRREEHPPRLDSV